MARISILCLCVVLAVAVTYASPTERQRGSMSETRAREIEEEARRNQAAVINELKDKFKNLKENCFPMPKGCRCVERGPGNTEVVKRIYVEAECRNAPHSNQRSGGA